MNHVFVVPYVFTVGALLKRIPNIAFFEFVIIVLLILYDFAFLLNLFLRS